MWIDPELTGMLRMTLNICLLTSACGGLGCQMCGTISSLYAVLKTKPKSLCMQGEHSTNDWHLRPQDSPPKLHVYDWPSGTVVSGNKSHRCNGDVLSSCLTSCPLGSQFLPSPGFQRWPACFRCILGFSGILCG